MSDEKRALTNRSNRLLEALRRLRDMETRKRHEPISSPGFHALAKDVDKTSREIFRLAREQDDLGDQVPRGRETIDDVDRSTRAEDGKRN